MGKVTGRRQWLIVSNSTEVHYNKDKRSMALALRSLETLMEQFQ